MSSALTADQRKNLRGYLLLGLDKGVEFVSEHTLKQFLHILQVMPPDDDLVKELNYLRGRGLLESEEREDPLAPGRMFWVHKITPAGHEIATGETKDQHIWFRK